MNRLNRPLAWRSEIGGGVRKNGCSMSDPRKFAVNLTDFFGVNVMRSLGRRMQPKLIHFFVVIHPRSPLLCLRMKEHALEATLVVLVRATIDDILGESRLSQVSPSVIRSVPVRVIDLMVWPPTRHPEPN